jgi:hypothetical protein
MHLPLWLRLINLVARKRNIFKTREFNSERTVTLTDNAEAVSKTDGCEWRNLPGTKEITIIMVI